MIRLRRTRLELCKALDRCHSCYLFNQLKDGNRLLLHCKSECQHWVDIQEKREQIERLQQRKRKQKPLFIDPKLEMDQRRARMAQIIGMKLTEFREECQLTQAQVARKLGVDHSTVSKHEKGQRKPTTKMLHLYAHIYNISLEKMIEDVEKIG